MENSQESSRKKILSLSLSDLKILRVTCVPRARARAPSHLSHPFPSSLSLSRARALARLLPGFSFRLSRSPRPPPYLSVRPSVRLLTSISYSILWRHLLMLLRLLLLLLRRLLLGMMMRVMAEVADIDGELGMGGQLIEMRTRRWRWRRLLLMAGMHMVTVTRLRIRRMRRREMMVVGGAGTRGQQTMHRPNTDHCAILRDGIPRNHSLFFLFFFFCRGKLAAAAAATESCTTHSCERGRRGGAAALYSSSFTRAEQEEDSPSPPALFTRSGFRSCERESTRWCSAARGLASTASSAVISPM